MSQPDAKAKADAATAEWKRVQSSLPEKDSTTVWGFYESSVWPTVSSRSDNWKTQVAWAMVGYIGPAFGQRKLSELTRAELQIWFNSLRLLTVDDPKSRKHGKRLVEDGSIGKIKGVFGKLMNLAEADGLIVSNPLRHVRVATAVAKERISLEPHQLRKLYEAAHPRLKPIVLLQGFCGARVGEACGAIKSHIDPQGVWNPQQQVLQLKGGAKLTSQLKTPNSYRAVPLADPVRDALFQGDSVWCAPSSDGGYLLPNNVQLLLDQACKDAGIDRITTHDLRHTFISILENVMEKPSPVVAELARKAKTGPLRGYSRSWLTLRRKVMEEYWKLVSTSVRQQITTKTG